MRLLRNLAAHVAIYSPMTVKRVMHYAENGYNGEPPLLTEEHFFVFNELTELKTSDYESIGEWEQIAGYALRNIEDGRRVLAVTRDRKIRTLEGVLGVLSTIKNDAHTTLAEGAL